jgi:hypothetical protein
VGAVPDLGRRVEFWHVDDAPEVLGLIGREFRGLVARILGDGAKPAG